MARKGNQDRGLFKRPSGTDVWWIRYAGPDHREHMERGGTKTEARRLLARRKTEIADGTWQAPHGHGMRAVDGERRPRSDTDVTLREFAERWLEERTPWLTKRVAHDYGLMLKRMLLSHAIARRPIGEVNDGDVARLVKELCGRKKKNGEPLSPRPVNMLIARLRTIFVTAYERGEDGLSGVWPLDEPAGIDCACQVGCGSEGESWSRFWSRFHGEISPKLVRSSEKPKCRNC